MCEHEEERSRSLQGAFMRLMHRYTEVCFVQLKHVGIHPGQLPFLKIIKYSEGISQSELATRLHVKPPTIAVSVKRLEKAEVIYRRPDPDDMRISRIYLTEKGMELAGQIEVLLEANEKALAAGFSEEELELAKCFFDRMVQNLDVLSEELAGAGKDSEHGAGKSWTGKNEKGGEI